VSSEVPGSIETGRWYDIRIEVQGTRIRCYLDGKLIHDFEEKPLPVLYAVASRNHRTREVILKVVNVSDKAVESEIRLQGIRSVQPAGKVIQLTSDTLDDENSLDNPTRVGPVESTLRGVAPQFRYTFPKHSLTVIVLKEK